MPHLSKVELSLLLVGDTLDLNERGVGADVALSTLVAGNPTLGVQTYSLPTVKH